MSLLTAEDLQTELQKFGAIVREGMRDDLQRILTNTLQEYRFSPTSQAPTVLPGRNVWSLPNQPSITEVEPTSNAEGDQSTANRDVSNALLQPPTRRPMRPVFEDRPHQMDPTLEKMAVMRAAISITPAVAQELKELGYFRETTTNLHVASKKQLTATTTPTNPDQADIARASTGTNQTARAMMLRGGPEQLETSEGNADYIDLHISLIAKAVHHNNFEYFVLFVICLNAMFIGFETNSVATGTWRDQATLFEVFEITFMIIFVIELGLRIFVFRWWFFSRKTPRGRTNPNLFWNVFDSCIVVVQVVEFIMQGLISSFEDSVLGKATILRLLRILRIGRLFRVGKLLRLFRTLRTIVHSISHSWQLFCWALISTVVIYYLFAVYITEVVSAELLQETVDPALQEYFGSVPGAMLSMAKATTGGIDWGDLYAPLRRVSLFAAYPFYICLMFCLIVVMNVFTGVFLDSVSQRAQQENELELVNNAFTIFKRSDTSDTGTITKTDFKASLSDADVTDFFNAIDLDVQQAEVLFELLDMSDDGVVSCAEFLRGCLRLHGTTKALDLLILSREVTQLFDWIARLNRENAETARLQREFLAKVTAENQHMLRAIHSGKK